MELSPEKQALLAETAKTTNLMWGRERALVDLLVDPAVVDSKSLSEAAQTMALAKVKKWVLYQRYETDILCCLGDLGFCLDLLKISDHLLSEEKLYVKLLQDTRKAVTATTFAGPAPSPSVPASSEALVFKRSHTNTAASALAVGKVVRKDGQIKPPLDIIYGFLTESPLFLPPLAADYLAKLDQFTPKERAAIPQIAHYLWCSVPFAPIMSDLPEDLADSPRDVQRLLVSSWISSQLAPPAGTVRRHGQLLPSALCPIKPDFAIVHHSPTVILAAAEAKPASAAPLEAMPQAFLAAASGAMALHHLLGSPSTVPFHTYNGYLEQHGLAYTLSNGLPCMVLVSPILDLGTREGSQRAAGFRLARINHAKALAKQLQELEDAKALQQHLDKLLKAPSHTFSLEKFYCKLPLTIGLTDEQAVAHQLLIFETLRKGKVPAVLPVTRIAHKGMSDDETKLEESRLVFPHLSAEGYTIGLPLLKEDFYSWLDAVQRAVNAMHKAGVVHMDLHPFNIMWRKAKNDTIDIQLIDFDGSLLKDELVPQALCDNVRSSPWCMAYPQLLVADQPPSEQIDAYFLAGIALAHTHDGDDAWRICNGALDRVTAMAKFREFLEEHREALEKCCAAVLSSTADVMKAFEQAGLHPAQSAAVTTHNDDFADGNSTTDQP